MGDQPTWTLTVGDVQTSLPADGEWRKVVRLAAAGEWGTITAQRVGSAEHITLRFNDAFGFLEHCASDEGPVSGARFPNRAPVSDGQIEFPCCGCGIPLEVDGECVLRKADAVRLFLQFLEDGVLPHEVAEPRQADVQPVLPALEKFLAPPAELNAVSWKPL